MAKENSRFAVTLQVTHAEVIDWLVAWEAKYHVVWREFPDPQRDSVACDLAQLESLLKKQKSPRLILLKSPVPQDLKLDHEFLSKRDSSRPWVVMDIGKKTRKGLYESYLTGFTSPEFMPLIRKIRSITQAGVRHFPSEVIDRSHRFTSGAAQMAAEGVAMLDLSGSVIELQVK